MPLGAITDIEHARGLAPRNTARGAWVAFGSPGEGGVASHAGAPRFIPGTPSRPARKGTRPAGLLSLGLPVRDLDRERDCRRLVAHSHLSEARRVVGEPGREGPVASGENQPLDKPHDQLIVRILHPRASCAAASVRQVQI